MEKWCAAALPCIKYLALKRALPFRMLPVQVLLDMRTGSGGATTLSGLLSRALCL